MTNSDDNANQPPQQPDRSVAAKRGWFRGKQRDEDARAEETINGRLRALRDGQFDQEEPQPEGEAESGDAFVLHGSLTFTRGPREGDQLSLAGRSVVLDIDANEAETNGRATVVATIWAQGEHFMARHNGGVRIGGGRPSLPIVVLEDGDELEWGAHRLRFDAGPPPSDGQQTNAAPLSDDAQSNAGPTANNGRMFEPPSDDALQFRDRLRRRDLD